MVRAGGCIVRLLQGIVVRRCGVIRRGLSSIELDRASPHVWCKLHQLELKQGQIGAISNFFQIVSWRRLALLVIWYMRQEMKLKEMQFPQDYLTMVCFFEGAVQAPEHMQKQ